MKEKMYDAVESILELADDAKKYYNVPIEKSFPAEANRRVEIDGKEYYMTVSIQLKPIEQ